MVENKSNKSLKTYIIGALYDLKAMYMLVQCKYIIIFISHNLIIIIILQKVTINFHRKLQDVKLRRNSVSSLPCIRPVTGMCHILNAILWVAVYSDGSHITWSYVSGLTSSLDATLALIKRILALRCIAILPWINLIKTFPVSQNIFNS